MAKSKIPLIDRFWHRVNKTGPTLRPELGPCWVWTAGTITGGYGAIKDGGVVWIASRLSWTIHNGPIPQGQCALHRCDNPPCVNPEHLFLGTKKDNAVDMGHKKRNYFPADFGKRNITRKLSEEQVRTIRTRAERESQGSLAREFGVHRKTIFQILNRHSWPNVA